MSPGPASQPNQPAEFPVDLAVLLARVDPREQTEWSGFREAVMNDLVLGLIAVAGFILFFVVAWRISAKSQQCPRCHHRLPRTETKCANCGWLDKEALQVGM
jgi:hypothetical protein